MDEDAEIRKVKEERQKMEKDLAALTSLTFDTDLYSSNKFEGYEQSIAVNEDDDATDPAENEVARNMASLTGSNQFFKEPLRAGEDDEMPGFRQPGKIIDREDDYRRRRLNRIISPERNDPFLDKTPGPEVITYSDVMREEALKRKEDEVKRETAKRKKEAEENKDTEMEKDVEKPKKRNRWDMSQDENGGDTTKSKASSDWDMPDQATPGIGRWNATPMPGRIGDATPSISRKNRWEETPTPGRVNDSESTPAGGVTPGATPAGIAWDATPKLGGLATQTPKCQRLRWDETPATIGSATPVATPAGAYTPGVTPFGAMDVPTPTPNALMRGAMTPEQYNLMRWEKDIEERSRPLTDEELDLMFPEEGYKVLDPPASYVAIRGVPCKVPKRCIEHCELFLPDCEFEKDRLVRMWISEGCIEQGVTKRMEDVGYSYFDALVQEEVIVPAEFDKVHRQMRYKFNTPQVGLLEQGKYLRIKASNMDGIGKEILHLTLQCERLDQIPFDSLKDLKQLHTLVVHEHCSASISQLPSSIFLGLRLLKTLDLSCTLIPEIPWSIGKLELLKYLDVSETPIKRLPESLDRLYSLQTLNLRDCVGVTALPRDFGMLVNLRHLDLNIVSQLESMPRGMGNLIELQTLQAYIVGKDDGCGIGELKNMNEITGSFCISVLENVTNVKEAKEAALYNKKHIDKLELRWRTCGNGNFEDTAEILECLQPHFGAKELQLTYYRGSKLPTWISDPTYSELSSMTSYKCISCDMLPSIGELPSLKILRVFNMDSVRNINSAFCRNHEDKVCAFPRLEKLTLDSMPALEEWTGVEDGDFPRLRHVAIAYCPKLRSLPPLSQLCSLEHIEISNCMQLVSLPEGSLPPSVDSLIIEA